jgi:Protein of unknown function (DUF1552)
MSHRHALNRRTLLRGIGGATLALPWLEAMRSSSAFAATPLTPKRIIIVTYAMGFVSTHWRPSAVGSMFTLPRITEPLAPFRDKMLFVSDVDNEVLNLNKQHPSGHQAKKESVLTGTLMRAAFGGNQSNRVENVIADKTGSAEGGPNNESICSFVGSRIRGSRPLQSVDLGVYPPVAPASSAPQRIPERFPSEYFFEGPAAPVQLHYSPVGAFNTYLSNAKADPAEAAALRRQRVRQKSVLDLVRDDFKTLKSGLNRADQLRLEEHAARIRSIEIDVARPTCNPGGMGPQPFTAQSNLSERAAVMQSILTQAVACDLAPVYRLEFFRINQTVFGIPSVDSAVSQWLAAGKTWHSMVHGEASPVDGKPTRGATPAPFLVDSYRFFVEQFAALADSLSKIPEGTDGRTALDKSLLVLASDFGDGNGHFAKKLGYILGGNLGTAKGGYHFSGMPQNGTFISKTTHNSTHVLNTINRIFALKEQSGAPVGSFGLQGFAQGEGTLPVFS